MIDKSAKCPKLGYLWCQAEACEAMVHYKQKTCPTCGAVQTRAPVPVKAKAALAPSPSVVADAARPVSAPSPAAPGPALGPTAGYVPTGRYVVMANFRGQVAEVLVMLRKGAVLEDRNLIAALLAQDAPIAPEADADGLATCPCCRHVFNPRFEAAALPGAKRLAG